jgi:hypothetical protein
MVVRRGWSGARPSGGVTIVAVTVSVAMVLRIVAGQGTAPAFAAVAIGFLGLAMIGPRLARVRRRSRTR